MQSRFFESTSYDGIITESHEIAVEYADMLSRKGHDAVIASTGDMLIVSTFADFQSSHATAPILEIFEGDPTV